MPTETYTSPTTGRVYPTRELSDGRHIMVSEYGWAIIEGDGGQARSDAIVDEAWKIQGEWMRGR